MSYMPSLRWQTTGFIYSAGLGFCLGLVYDFFRIIFYLLTGSDKKHAAVRDIMFMLVFLWADFLFLLIMCSGRLVLYAFAGEGIGLAVYFYSLSGSFYPPLKQLFKRVRRAVLLFLNILTARFAHFRNFLIEKLKKLQKILKKLLQIRHNLLYNPSVKVSEDAEQNLESR